MAEFMHINSRHLDPAVASRYDDEYAFALKVRPKAFCLPPFFSLSLARRTRRSFCRLHLSPRRTRLRETIALAPIDAFRKLTRDPRPNKTCLVASLSAPVFNIRPPNRERTTRRAFISRGNGTFAQRSCTYTLFACIFPSLCTVWLLLVHGDVYFSVFPRERFALTTAFAPAVHSLHCLARHFWTLTWTRILSTP